MPLLLRMRPRFRMSTESLANLTDVLTVLDKCLGARRGRVQSGMHKKPGNQGNAVQLTSCRSILLFAGPRSPAAIWFSKDGPLAMCLQ